jgi:hypothetical protein
VFLQPKYLDIERSAEYDVRSTRERKGRVVQMLFTDRAFSIWMGHAGEDAQVFVQDEPVIDRAAFERTQVLAIARHDTLVAQAPVIGRQVRDCEPERLAA